MDNKTFDKVGNNAYVVGKYAQAILVKNSNELATLTHFAPGSMAYTADGKNFWCLDVDGKTWKPFG